MTRSFSAAVLALTLIAGSAAHAETARITFAASSLDSSAGRAAVSERIAVAADRYCRANAVGGTVARCRQTISTQMNRTIDAKAVQYAKAASPMQYAQR